MASDAFGLVGTTIDNRYRVDSVVGEGGFGVVYRGHHLSFKHAVAVKCLKLPAHFTPEAQALFLEKFREEGSFLSRLSEHPSIVRVFDLNVTSTPGAAALPFLVLEWLEGRDLEQLRGDRRAAGQPPLTEAEAVALLRPAVDAIALAHSLKIAHRDLKPANLFLARTSRGSLVKVLDFGIAKAMQDGETATQLVSKTSSGFSAFSPQYGAAEQFRPKRFGTSGPWTDVHALGLILTELVTGKPPYDGDELMDFYEAGTAARRPTPRARGAAVSDAFEALCARAVALESRARFEDAGALGAALDALPSSPSASLDPRTPCAVQAAPEPAPAVVQRTAEAAPLTYVETAPPEVRDAAIARPVDVAPLAHTPLSVASPRSRLPSGIATGVLVAGVAVAAYLGLRGGSDQPDANVSASPPRTADEAAAAPRSAPTSREDASPSSTVVVPPSSVAWRVPPSFVLVPSPNAMRLATYRFARAEGDAADAELTVSVAGGTVDDNIARWTSDFDAVRERRPRTVVTISGLTVTAVWLEGSYKRGPDVNPTQARSGFALLGAIVERPSSSAGDVHFFKLIGPARTVEAAAPAFGEILASLTPSP